MSYDVIEISLAWWFKWYIAGVKLICLVTGMEPNEQKSLYWCKKAVRARRNGKRIKVLYADHGNF